MTPTDTPQRPMQPTAPALPPKPLLHYARDGRQYLVSQPAAEHFEAATSPLMRMQDAMIVIEDGEVVKNVWARA